MYAITQCIQFACNSMHREWINYSRRRLDSRVSGAKKTTADARSRHGCNHNKCYCIDTIRVDDGKWKLASRWRIRAAALAMDGNYYNVYAERTAIGRWRPSKSVGCSRHHTNAIKNCLMTDKFAADWPLCVCVCSAYNFFSLLLFGLVVGVWPQKPCGCQWCSFGRMADSCCFAFLVQP